MSSRPAVGRRPLRFLERELREAEAAARSTLAKGGRRPSLMAGARARVEASAAPQEVAC
jgi:hypothetical protein